MRCSYKVLINTETGAIEVTASDNYQEPYGVAMCNEICAAIESALQGDYIGGFEMAGLTDNEQLH
jgi:hypothetical protein